MGGVPEGVEGRAREVLEGLPGRDVDLFVVRLRRWWHDLAEGLAGPYGERHDLGELLERVAVLLAERYRERAEELKLLDLERSHPAGLVPGPGDDRLRRATRTGSPAPSPEWASTSTTSASWASATCT